MKAIHALLLILMVSAAHAAPVVERGRKICQLTGEVDRSIGQPTINRTETMARFWGTDLGASFEHDGKVVFLFGDTHAAPGLERARDRDIIATSTDGSPDDCLKLDVMTNADGGYRPLSIAGVDGGEFSVPTTGFSANGAMYVLATTGRSASKVMERSVLARSTNGGRDFQPLYTMSSQHFINAAAVQGDQGVMLFGSGAYRASSPHLAVLANPEDRASLRYFAGMEGDAPKWSAREDQAKPLFDQACVGEISAIWNQGLKKWVMVYNCGAPQSQILLRTADNAWGPYSNPQVLFDAADGFCTFMNALNCHQVSDPHNPQVAGDPYAPYLISRFSQGPDLYFLMSTWNPYNVVLMKARLVEPKPSV